MTDNIITVEKENIEKYYEAFFSGEPLESGSYIITIEPYINESTEPDIKFNVHLRRYNYE